ncbi:NAD(P)H-hydrate epimerase, partial [Planctomycetota bacterium]|nr:NAD(P)H-hydrate epimerase [Planctomycetota bacterium]
ELGMPSFALMENAARACVFEASKIIRRAGVAKALDAINSPGSRDDIPRNVTELERWKSSLDSTDSPIVIVCGPGNNGGDGFAIARTLHNRGRDVAVFYAGELSGLDVASDDVKLNVSLLRKLDVDIRSSNDGLEAALSGTPLIVDALFGTGLTRNIAAPLDAVIRAVNAANAPTLAVDIPSGLDADTGEVLGVCVRALTTVTFVANKPGFTLGKGAAHTGQVVVAEIGIPRQWIKEAANG